MGLDKAGLFEITLEEQVINFHPGDVFLFVTDGVTEAQAGNGKEFGEDRLLSLLTSQAGNNAAVAR